MSEIVDELHDRGYDASQFVASLRTAEDGEGGLFDWLGQATRSPFERNLDGGSDSFSNAFDLRNPFYNDDAPSQTNPQGSGAYVKRDEPSSPTGSSDPDAFADLSNIGEDPADPAPAPAAAAAASGTGVSEVSSDAGGGGGGGAGGGGSAGGYVSPPGGTRGPVTDGGRPGAENGDNSLITTDSYTTQAGDTLTDIAQRTYGDMNRYEEIATNNNITNTDQLDVGTTLNLPGAGGASPAPAAADAPALAAEAPTPAQANAGPPPDNAGQATFAPGAPVPPVGTLARRRYAAGDHSGDLFGDGAGSAGGADLSGDDDETKKTAPPASTTTTTPPSSSSSTPPASTPVDSRSPAAGASGGMTAQGIPIPTDTQDQMTQDNFGSSKSQPKTQTLEERLPRPGQSTSTGDSGGMGDFGSVMGEIGPALSGLTTGLGPLVGEIGSAVAPAISGLASGLGGALSGLFSMASAPNEGSDHDAGLPAEDFSTSEEWINANESDCREDVTDGDGDITSYTPPRQQPKQASYDDNDIVRQFQANIGNTALASGGGGGGYSDDAISQAAQGFLRTAGRVYSLAEQQELIDESHPQGARNLPGLDLRGTHYLEG